MLEGVGPLTSQAMNPHLLVIVHNGVQSMSNGQNCATFKFLSDSFLNEVICLHVNSSSSLVQHENLGLA